MHWIGLEHCNPLQSLVDANKGIIEFFTQNTHDLGLSIAIYAILVKNILLLPQLQMIQRMKKMPMIQ